MEMSLWLEFRVCLCARCAPNSSHSSILKTHGNVAVARVSCVSMRKMCPRLEPHQHFEEACCSGIANVAVARVSCILRAPRRLGDSSAVVCLAAAPCTFSQK